LRHAYDSILRVLDEFELPGTFAFVGVFSQTPDEFARIRPAIEALGRKAPNYLGPALRDIDQSQGDGWHGRDLVDAVAESRISHEIALHGVTHVPWTALDETSAEAEMEVFEALGGPIRESRTFVYPRNLVAHPEVLARHGFTGFRAARPARSRALSLLSEFNLLEQPEAAKPPGAIAHIPAGFFLNWRSGPRRLVPPDVTRWRAKRLLSAAGRSGGVVHYWLHPENVASAPSTLQLLRALAHEVVRSRDAGACEVMTQLGYCGWADSLR
jgi:peptidoglycan/xylan/chitin deacetylase (PgdA/CDA1 family)